jgi:3-oxoadipate enol-lactonase
VIPAHTVDGPADAPVVVLGNSLGTTWEMWDALLPALSRYRVVRHDTRGHGRSPVPDGPYTVEELATDVLDLVSSLGVDRFALVGLSLGGAVAQHLCATRPDLVSAAVLCCTAPAFGDPAQWHARAATVRASGMRAIEEATRGRWFTDDFRATSPQEVDRLVAMLTSTPAEGYASCCEALSAFDGWRALASVEVPVRVVAGFFDPVCPVDTCDAMASAIRGADLVVVREASHLANAEQPEAFNAAVVEHLEKHL